MLKKFSNKEVESMMNYATLIKLSIRITKEDYIVLMDFLTNACEYLSNRTEYVINMTSYDVAVTTVEILESLGFKAFTRRESNRNFVRISL